MRVVYYVQPCFLDCALPFIREMSKLVDLHVILQLAPGSWRSTILDIEPVTRVAGVVSASEVFDGVPDNLKAYWSQAASFSAVVHTTQMSLHPASLGVTYKASKHMRRIKPHVLHVEGLSSRMMLGQLLLRDIPQVYTLHDPEPHTGENRLRKSFIRHFSFGRAAHLILHNHEQAEPFAARYGIDMSRISVTPLGVYDCYRAVAERAPSTNGRNVLFFGRLSQYKGLDVLYQAAPLVCAQLPDVHFTIAGRRVPGYQPPTPPELSNGGRFHFLETFISPSRLGALIQEASLVVCPYIDATQSGVVLTSYAFGKPVVASKVGGLPEYVVSGETGRLVEPGSPESLAEGLVSLLSELSGSPGTPHRYAARIDELSKGRLAWCKIAKLTLDAYEKALAASKRE